jgi:hypothetical protein
MDAWNRSEPDAARFFAPSYALARSAFLAEAETAGLAPHALAHPMRGRDGEALAMDVARDGPSDAPALLIVSSACHGVEGFCGSGVQRALLAESALRAKARSAGVALLFIHALNPYGFSWLRRTTHENVDLNRNVHDFAQPLPANPGYEALAHAIVPPNWPPPPEAEAEIQAYAAVHGQRGLQAAISGGQHTHPAGIFYGGLNPTWSQQQLRHVLRQHGRRCERLGWIDLHTGLGPSGVGEKIFAGGGGQGESPADALARCRAWWGPEVTSIDEGSSSSAPLTGLIWNCAPQECPQADITAIALEYGTVPLMQTLQALRAEQWLENHPETDEATAARIKREMLDAFFVDTPAWKASILDQGLAAVSAAISGLAADRAR